MMPKNLSVAALALALAGLPEPARAQEPAPSPQPPSLRQTAPEDGVGLMTGGTYLIVGGATLLGASSYMTATVSSDWAVGIVGGALLAGGGSTFVWLGSRRAKALRAWSSETGLEPPPTGTALLISGFTLGGSGLISMIAFGGLSIGYCVDDCFNPNPAVWFGLAGTAVGAGLGMVIAGAILKKRHRRWREQDDLVRLSPTFAFTPAGAQFGVAGRF